MPRPSPVRYFKTGPQIIHLAVMSYVRYPLSLHEDDGSVPGGIGITGALGLEGLHTVNDRIIHDWLTYAGQYDVKTVDRHLSAIRYCEGLLAGKPFSKLTRDDVAKVRRNLR